MYIIEIKRAQNVHHHIRWSILQTFGIYLAHFEKYSSIKASNTHYKFLAVMCVQIGTLPNLIKSDPLKKRSIICKYKHESERLNMNSMDISLFNVSKII